MGEPGGPRRGGQRGCACARGCERCPRCCRVSRHAAPTRLSSLRPRVHRYVLQSYRWRGSLCPPRQGRERPDVCVDTVRERGGWGGASFAGRVSVVFVIVVSIYNLHSRSSITAITVPPPPSPLPSAFANGSGEAERPVVEGGGGLQRGEGGLCTIRFPARCEAVSLLLPAPGYSERDVVLLVYLSTTNRWRNSRVCAAEVPVVLLEGGEG